MSWEEDWDEETEDTEEELLMQEQEAQRLADLKERERKDRRNGA